MSIITLWKANILFNRIIWINSDLSKIMTNTISNTTFLLKRYLILSQILSNNPWSNNTKYLNWSSPQPGNIGLKEIHRTSPKDSICPSWGLPDQTSRVRAEMTSRGSSNLTLKGRPWEIYSGFPQDVHRTSPRGTSKHSTWMSQKIF